MKYNEYSINELNYLEIGFAQILEDLIARVIPEQELKVGRDWDYIRVEIWEDSGRIIFFPSSSKKINRIDKFGNNIICQELVEKVEKFDQLDISEDEFDQLFFQLQNHIANRVLNFFSSQSHFALRCFNQDDEEMFNE